jgi:lipoprotein-releasing system ATP-binding protein
VAVREASRGSGSGERPVLVAQGLVRRLGQGAAAREVLRGIDLEIHEGEFAALVGPSGSGKSTLLYLLGGLDHPDAGNVEIEGENLARVDDDALARLRNRLIGFVYQFHFLLPEFSALENVLMPLWARGGGRSRTDRAWATELLGRVGLAEAAGKLPREMSGGEQQRVAVARALVNEPTIVLADEPSGNLDDRNSESLHALVRELSSSKGQTFIIVTHKKELLGKADRGFVLAGGILHQIEKGSDAVSIL